MSAAAAGGGGASVAAGDGGGRPRGGLPRAVAAGGGGVSAPAGVGDTAAAFPTKRLKHVVALRRLRTSAGDAARPYVGLEDIESGTGRLVNGFRGKWASSPPAPSVTDGDEEPGRCFRQNAGGNSPSAPSVTDGNAATGTDFEPGDVLFGKLRPYLAKAWVAEFPGRCTTEALVMKPTSIEPRFLRSVCLSSRFVSDVDASTFGSKMPRAEWDFIGNMPVPVPDLDTQRAIADHLDRETARLDALVAAKERLLKLLAEKRRAVVTRAVIRGLDPRAPMRDSGVPWLGEIPAHWDVRRLKFLLAGIDQGASPACFNFPAGAGSFGVLRTGCVNGGVFREDENKALPHRSTGDFSTLVNVGDVLMSRASGSVNLIGSVALVEKEPSAKLLLSDKIFRLNIEPAIIDSRYLVLVAGTPSFRHQVGAVVSGAEGLANNIAKSDVLDLWVTVPPLAEQCRIADIIGSRIVRMDRLQTTTRDTISIIEERRAALIAAAVTGRLDVGRTPCG